jgi:DNA polymerase-3 subunit delta'
MPGQLDAVFAQPTAVGTLQRALESDRVHHAYLFDGPPGVGKEMAAFGLAQALVCEKRTGKTVCGQCSSCGRAIPRDDGKSRHPDVIVIERALYEPQTIGRRTPETQEISIDQIRTLVLARAAYPPHEGRAKVIVIRRAEELSISAANALLKTLEEPIAKTHFVLLTTALGALLPTVQSRSQRVRFGPLPDDVLEKILVAKGISADVAKSVVPLAEGSVELALAACDPDDNARREAFVTAAERAIASGDFGAALELAEDAKKEKDALPGRISALGARLAARARTGDPRDADRFAFTLQALRDLEGNASAQLVVESMMLRMRAV